MMAAVATRGRTSALRILHRTAVGLRRSHGAALVGADLPHAAPPKRPVFAPEVAEHYRLRALDHLDQSGQTASGELQAALVKLAEALRARGPIAAMVDAFAAVGARLGPTSSATLPGATRAMQSLALLDRLLSERAHEMDAEQLAATAHVFASCGIEAPHSAEAMALQIRHELRARPAQTVERALLPLAAQMNAAATRRLISAAVQELASRPDVPTELRPISGLPTHLLAAAVPVLARWRSQLRSFAERDPAERALGELFETLGRGPHADWLTDGAARAGAGVTDEPLYALLVTLEEIRAAGEAAELASAHRGGAAGAAAAEAAAAPTAEQPSSEGGGGARDAHEKRSHTYMHAQARALLHTLSRVSRAVPARLDDASLGALIEASVSLAPEAAGSDPTLQVLCDEWQRRTAARPLPVRALGGILKLARVSRRHMPLLNPLVELAHEQLRAEAVARADAAGVPIEAHRRVRAHAAPTPTLSEPLAAPQLARIAIASASALSKRGGRNASPQQHGLYNELCARLAADAEFGLELECSLAVDLLVNMCRVGLGSVAGANALLARVVGADGGPRAVRLSNAQLSWLMYALGTTATAGAEAAATTELLRKRAGGLYQLREPVDAPLPSALGGRAAAALAFERPNWLWHELTLLALERFALEPRSRMHGRDGVRALWGICQAGRYAPRPLAELSAAVVDALRPLDALAPPSGAAGARADGEREARAWRLAAGAPLFDGAGDGAEPSGPSGTRVRRGRAELLGQQQDGHARAMTFAALAALEIEMPAAVPALEARSWAALQSWWDHLLTRSPTNVSAFQRELSAALGALGLAHDVEPIVELPLAHATLRYSVDFRLRGLPVLLEAHGSSHLLWQGTQRYTTQKHRLLRARGFRVVEIFAPDWNAHRPTQQRPGQHLRFLAEALADEAGVLTDAVAGTLARPPPRALS